MNIAVHNLDSWTLQLLRQTNQHVLDHNQQAYLTGGSTRNLLLNEPCTDWDIVTSGDASLLARTLADKLEGHYVHMHDKASRVVVKHQQQETILDIAPLKGNTIEEDLHQRDFTINAIAAPLAEVTHYLDVGNPIQFIDPLNGLADISARRLKAVNDNVFKHDPLRMLRAIRLNMRYQLSIDPSTEHLIKRDAKLLLLAAPERIHDELCAILEPDGATGQLRYLDALGLLTVLMPEFIPARGMPQPSPHYWDVLEHSLEAVGALERLATLLTPSSHQEEHGRTGPIYRALGREANLLRVDFLSTETTETMETTETTGTGSRWNPAWGAGNPPHPTSLHPYGHDGPLPKNLPLRGEVNAAPRPDTDTTQNDLAEIRTLLQEAEQQGIFQLASLAAPRMKLAALLHDIGKPITYFTDEVGKIHFYDHPQAGIPLAQRIMTRLSASTQDRRLVQLVTAHHMRPGQLAHVDLVTPRAVRRYFVDLGPTGIHVALFSLADHLATPGPLWDEYIKRPDNSWERHLALVRTLLTRYIRERQSILPARLVSPEELMRRLKLQPGPIIGQLLEHIAEAQAEGLVHSKEEAIWLAEEKLSQ